MKEQEEKKETEKEKSAGRKTLSGTDETSALEKAAETIAGDNKLMGVALKLLLSPITMIVGAGALLYCFVKIRSLHSEIEKLKTENQRLSDEKEESEEDYHKLKKKHKKLKELLAPENEMQHLGNVQNLFSANEQTKKKTYNTAYLD